MIKFRKKSLVAAASLVVGATLLTACGPGTTNAKVSSDNLSVAADNFEVNRRVVFFNGITDKYLLVIEGRCSITDDSNQLEVMCRVGPDEYKKEFLGLSDNVSYFVEQLKPIDVSVYHHRVIYKPETIIPEIEIQTGKQ